MMLWWPVTPRPGNVGDLIGPFLYEASTGTPALRADKPSLPGIALACGSVAGLAGPGTIVWGCGAMRDTDRLNPQTLYTAVRGPITRYLVHKAGGTCPALYGDPGLLLPSFVPPAVQHPTVGIVPHYVDGERARALYHYEQIISPLQSVPDFVADLTSCSWIGSSSLHGIVLAHAYGIPAVWLRLSDGVLGDGFKFFDYFESVGLDPTVIDCRTEGDVVSDATIRERATCPTRLPDLDRLWEVRPWA